jgi:hypothetical protein
VVAGDGDALQELFAQSRDARNAWLRRIEQGR